MSDKLMKYVSGGELVPLRDRRLAKQAKDVSDEVRMKGFQMDGAIALGGHAMEALMGLDDRRRELSQGDPVTDLLLTEIESVVIRQTKNIQASLYSQWGV